MGQRIALLRGINVGSHKRIGMASLRDAFSETTTRNWTTVTSLLAMADEA